MPRIVTALPALLTSLNASPGRAAEKLQGEAGRQRQERISSMNHFAKVAALCIIAMSVVAGPAKAGFYDISGRHRGVAEFRADAQACANTWAAEHPRPAIVRPHPILRATVRQGNPQTARYNFLIYSCLPAHGWRPTGS
jgi:hypothetical protein